MKKGLNGYTIVFRKMENNKESEKCIPMLVDDEDIEETMKENELIDRGIRYLRGRLEGREKIEKSKYHKY